MPASTVADPRPGGATASTAAPHLATDRDALSRGPSAPAITARDPATPTQLELTRTTATSPTDGDLPRPREDRVGRPIRGVWMIGDDDDRLLRRGTREDLWSLQRSQQRPQLITTI